MKRIITAYPLVNKYTEYYDKVLACWLGKNIGGTLGVPFEGNKNRLDVEYYTNLEEVPLANDDLDLQLLWLHALEQYGPQITSRELAQEWVDHVFYSFDEYGYSMNNLRLGLIPPLSGNYGNPFTDCMGAPIRSEIWACVNPGNPDRAVYYAYQDAIVDHAGGEGVYGEMYFAAVQSAAFVMSDRDELLQLGLTYIPSNCRTSKVIRSVIAWHGEGKNWQENRELVIEHFGKPNFTDAPQNIAFIIIGWLYGKDFSDAICIAVNCGYDTDCTGATLGSIWGIINGSQGFPDKWVRPLGEKIVVSPEVNGFKAPRTLQELTDRVCSMAKIVSVWAEQQREIVPIHTLWTKNYRAVEYKSPSSSYDHESLQTTIQYGEDGPVIGLADELKMVISITNQATVEWSGRMVVDVPSTFESISPLPIHLQVGETLELGITLKSGQEWQMNYEVDIRLVRQYNDSHWSAISIPITILPKRKWIITDDLTGKRVEGYGTDSKVPLNLLQLSKAGQVTMSTNINNPKDQQIRLITATGAAITTWLDDSKVVEVEASNDWVPAFHRAREGNYADMHLTAGEHQLTMTVCYEGEVPDVHVMLVEQAAFKFVTKPEIRIG